MTKQDEKIKQQARRIVDDAIEKLQAGYEEDEDWDRLDSKIDKAIDLAIQKTREDDVKHPNLICGIGIDAMRDKTIREVFAEMDKIAWKEIEGYEYPMYMMDFSDYQNLKKKFGGVK